MNPFASLITSRKTWLSLFSTAIATVGLLGGLRMLTDPGQKLTAIQTYLVTVAGIWGLNVAAIAHEDAAAKSGPQSQTNVGSNVTNAPPAEPAPVIAPVAPVAPPAPLTREDVAQVFHDELMKIRRTAPPATPKPTPNVQG